MDSGTPEYRGKTSFKKQLRHYGLLRLFVVESTQFFFTRRLFHVVDAHLMNTGLDTTKSGIKVLRKNLQTLP